MLRFHFLLLLILGITAIAFECNAQEISPEATFSDRQAINRALQEALEFAPSNTPREWRNPQTNDYGSITVSPAEATAGTTCRRYEFTWNIRGRTARYAGRPCRNEAKSIWDLRKTNETQLAQALPPVPSTAKPSTEHTWLQRQREGEPARLDEQTHIAQRERKEPSPSPIPKPSFPELAPVAPDPLKLPAESALSKETNASKQREAERSDRTAKAPAESHDTLPPAAVSQGIPTTAPPTQTAEMCIAHVKAEKRIQETIRSMPNEVEEKGQLEDFYKDFPADCAPSLGAMGRIYSCLIDSSNGLGKALEDLSRGIPATMTLDDEFCKSTQQLSTGEPLIKVRRLAKAEQELNDQSKKTKECVDSLRDWFNGKLAVAKRGPNWDLLQKSADQQIERSLTQQGTLNKLAEDIKTHREALISTIQTRLAWCGG